MFLLNISPDYYLMVKHSGKFLTVVESEEGLKVIQHKIDSLNNKTWKFIPSGEIEDYYYIIVSDNEGCLEKTPNGQLKIGSINGEDGQKWAFRVVSTDDFYLIMSKDGGCLSVNGSSMDDGYEVIVYNDVHGTENQQWKLLGNVKK